MTVIINHLCPEYSKLIGKLFYIDDTSCFSVFYTKLSTELMDLTFILENLWNQVGTAPFEILKRVSVFTPFFKVRRKLVFMNECGCRKGYVFVLFWTALLGKFFRFDSNYGIIIVPRGTNYSISTGI